MKTKLSTDQWTRSKFGFFQSQLSLIGCHETKLLTMPFLARAEIAGRVEEKSKIL